MSKEKQIEEMAKTLCEDCAKSDPCSLAAVGGMCNSVRKQATAMYTACYRKQEWIIVEERLPEDMYGKHRKKITVLVCTESGRVSTASRQRVFCFDQTKKKWLELDAFEWNNRKRVTHWMPLPEPPKGECYVQSTD